MTATAVASNTGTRRPLTLSFGASAAVQALNVMTGVLLARTLGPDGRGELAAVLLWPTVIAAIGGLGVAEAVTFHIARDAGEAQSVLATALTLALIQSAVCVGIGAALIPFVLTHFDASASRAAYIFLAFIPANLLTLTLMGALNGLHRFGQFHSLRLTVIVLTGFGIGALRLFDDLTVVNAAIVYVGATAVTGLAAALLLARSCRIGLAIRPRLSGSLLAYGIKSHTGSVSWMMNERLDQLVISVFLVPIKLGLYVTAVTMTSVISIVGSSVATAAFPVVAKLRSLEERRDAARRFVRLALFGSLAVAVPLIVVAPIVIDVFFKHAYSDAANVSRVLMVAAVVLSTNRALGACLKAMNRPLDTGIAEAVALAVTIGVLAALLPVLGIMGAAIASLAAYSTSTAWMLARTARALDVPVVSLILPVGEHEPARRLARRYIAPAEVKP